MLNYILKNPIPHQSFYKKYASKKYMKVSRASSIEVTC